MKNFMRLFYSKIEMFLASESQIWLVTLVMGTFPFEYWLFIFLGRVGEISKHLVGIYILLVPVNFCLYGKLIKSYRSIITKYSVLVDKLIIDLSRSQAVSVSLMEENAKLHSRLEKGYE